MQENKKGMFTGFSRVFSFTASQTVKGKGFKLSTILLGLVIMIGFSLISILMAVSQDGDDKSGEDINSVVDMEEALDIDIYYVNGSTFTDDMLQGIMAADSFKKSTFTVVDENEREKALSHTNEYLKGKKDAVVLDISENKEKITIDAILPYETEVSADTAEIICTAFTNYLDFVRVHGITELDELHTALYGAGVFSQALAAGDSAEDLGVMLTRLLVPMIFSLILYMMILLYGQNITKVVVAEKSSKLMETLLTSVKPYAIISGKILAVSGIAVVQLAVWAASAVMGYIIGEHIAEALNPGYTNYVSLILDIIGGSSDAFSAGAFVVAVLMIVIGFLMYCVLAGMVAAMVDRMEDISSVMALFQIPVVIGFMASYFVQMSENDTLLGIVRYCPVTSPFCVPADILVGNMDILQSVVSLALVIAVTFGLILFTGKIYKGKLFNRH